MQWTDTAIILSSKKQGESSALVRVLSHEHGVYGGVVRSATSKNNRGLVQPGNIVNTTWNARLSEQLGTLRLELQTAYAAQIMQDSVALAALSSACALLEYALPERHPYPNLYAAFSGLLERLVQDKHWPAHYVLFEIMVLAETGFGLDFSQCAATGTTEDLIYVSPKSGRAVSRSAGEPYKDRLLPLPSFLCHPRLARGSKDTHSSDIFNSRSPRKAGMTGEEILAGLTLTGYFLEHWLLAPHGRKLPAARARLLQYLQTIPNEVITQHGT